MAGTGDFGIECDPTRVDQVSEPPETHILTGSTVNENSSRIIFPSNRSDEIPLPQESVYFSGSTENDGEREPELMIVNANNSPATGIRSPKSLLFSGSTISESSPRLVFPSKERVGISQAPNSHLLTK